MNNPGEYPHVNTRRTNVRATLVTDGTAKTTVRLRASNLTIPGQPNRTENITHFTFYNPGPTGVAFDVVESDSANAASGRTVLVAVGTLVPLGSRTAVATASRPYLEVRSNGANGQLEMQIDSRIKYDVLSFNRRDTMAPKSIWKDARRAAWSTL